MNNHALDSEQNPAILVCTLGESVLQIRDQVFGVFEADGNADGSWSDSRRGEFVGAHFVMRTVDWQNHERFDAA
jgi:hypothetical protein